MPGAGTYWVQSAHRETALQYLIQGAAQLHKQHLSAHPADDFSIELEEIMPQWAIETLAQGAYMREYHIWEKETKEYFSQQLIYNGLDGQTAKVRQKSNENYVEAIERILLDFSISNLEIEIMEVNGMREKVNVAKHDPGVLTEHFISIEEFWRKHSNISSFWSKLADLEEFVS